MKALPAERELLELVARYQDAERRIRALLAQAVSGDRRALLAEALRILAALRREAPSAGDALERAFLVSAGATAILLGQALVLPSVAAVRDLAGSLVKQVTESLLSAEQGSREAFRAVTANDLDERAGDAVVAKVDTLGRRLSLSVHVEVVTRTLGAHAVTRGLVDTLPAGTPVRFSSHRSANPICRPHEGKVFPVEDAPRPPLHPRCGHRLTPTGASVPDLAAAMDDVDQRLEVRAA